MTVLEKVEVLQKLPIFQGVRTESLARVAALAQEVSYQPNQQLYRENEAADSMFVLLDGEVSLSKNGRESGRIGAENLVGARALLAADTQPDSAVATAPTQALQIDQQDFFDAMAEDFNITRGILRALIQEKSQQPE